jgi:hypothetical protein
MKLNSFDRIALALATIFLGMIALHPLFKPDVAQAQGVRDHLYIEPGIALLRAPDKEIQTQGKVVVDLTNGNVWGFPTAVDAPYLVDPLRPKPLLSSPIFLGKFDLAAMHKNQ